MLRLVLDGVQPNEAGGAELVAASSTSAVLAAHRIPVSGLRENSGCFNANPSYSLKRFATKQDLTFNKTFFNNCKKI